VYNLDGDEKKSCCGMKNLMVDDVRCSSEKVLLFPYEYYTLKMGKI